MQGFERSETERYKEEAREYWCHTDAYKEYAERTESYSHGKWNALAEGMDGIMAEFAACMSRNEACDSPDAQELVKTLQKYISANFYCCTNEILAGLGEMYAADERFCSSIDRHADGTALFIREAISVYCTAHT